MSYFHIDRNLGFYFKKRKKKCIWGGWCGACAVPKKDEGTDGVDLGLVVCPLHPRQVAVLSSTHLTLISTRPALCRPWWSNKPKLFLSIRSHGFFFLYIVALVFSSSLSLGFDIFPKVQISVRLYFGVCFPVTVIIKGKKKREIEGKLAYKNNNVVYLGEDRRRWPWLTWIFWRNIMPYEHSTEGHLNSYKPTTRKPLLPYRSTAAANCYKSMERGWTVIPTNQWNRIHRSQTDKGEGRGGVF